MRFVLCGGTILVGVGMMMSEAMQKLFEQEKRESVFEMLKDNIKLEKIIKYERVTKEFVLKVANENNLNVNEG